ncbi:MAG TPA: efflux RND transporter periplasmic adaptor subunit, partial [Syntrophomonas sp.]|nr:efflux RND transporter periplasmic adaptor subunit [Syntrophomonas sp.]
MKKKRWLYGGIVLVVAVLAGVAVYQGGVAEMDAVKVTRAAVARTVDDTAVVQAVNESLLYAQQSGTVAAVEVELGQEVKAGQALIRLDNPDLNIQASQTESQMNQTRAGLDSASAALNRTRLQLDDARKNLERVNSLLQSGAASQSEYEQALTAVQLLESTEKELTSSQQAAQAQLKNLESTLGEVQGKKAQLIVTAATSGKILSIDVKKGAAIMPGQLLSSIGSSQHLELKAHILSDDLAEIAVGQAVDITAPVLGTKVLKGQITQIYPKAEEKQSALGVIQRRVPVMISMEETGTLQPGFEVRIAIQTRQEPDALVVPRQSVRTVS